MEKVYFTLVIAFFTTLAFAQVKPQTVTRSSVTFKIKNLGISVDGKFGGFKGTIVFDPAKLDSSTIEATVDANTIDTDNGTRNDHLKSDSYFDVAKYPTITMKSVSFKHKSGSNYTGTFNLTIKDKTSPIEVPFTYTESGNTTTFKGSFKIRRTDYGVGGHSMVMSNDVNVFIELSATK